MTCRIVFGFVNNAVEMFSLETMRSYYVKIADGLCMYQKQNSIVQIIAIARMIPLKHLIREIYLTQVVYVLLYYIVQVPYGV
ncbi:hypothetical protein ST41_09780 [Prevotella pectinovora]|nr:hypothetical protein ST41_09780 [Prevotella pectinovora]